MDGCHGNNNIILALQQETIIIIQEKSGFLVFPFQQKRIKYCLSYKIVILKPVTLCFVSYIIRGNNCM